MAKNTKMRLEGAEALLAKLDRMDNRLSGLLLKRAAEAGAEIIAEEARSLAPVDTGHLRDSIEAEAGPQKQGQSQWLVGYGKDAYYGEFIELGTDDRAAHPFLRPAIEAKKEEATAKVGSVLAEALKGI